jgi:hypothetical protein
MPARGADGAQLRLGTTDRGRETKEAMGMENATETGNIIIAQGSGEYRVKRYIMVAVIIGMGLWFGYDGFKRWPAQNARIDQIEQEQRSPDLTPEQREALAKERKGLPGTKHSDTDLLWQKILFFTLPPLGLAYLVWTLYNSRGRYRLEGTHLSVPGHPTIELDQITKIDKQLWDRKGIAYIDYDANGRTGTLRLDDFVYQAKPTRDIFKRVEEHTLARVAAATGETPAATEG